MTDVTPSSNHSTSGQVSSTLQNAQNGEQEWCHIQATITMLCLAVCQIQASLNDSSQSVDQLTASFTNLATSVSDIASASSDNATLAEFRQAIQGNAQNLNQQISQAVSAFQFYDRISQRLDHVVGNLRKTSDLLHSQKHRKQPDAWHHVQEDIRKSYTMESERIMFEHIIRGASVDEALEIYRHHFAQHDNASDANDDEIELF